MFKEKKGLRVDRGLQSKAKENIQAWREKRASAASAWFIPSRLSQPLPCDPCSHVRVTREDDWDGSQLVRFTTSIVKFKDYIESTVKRAIVYNKFLKAKCEFVSKKTIFNWNK